MEIKIKPEHLKKIRKLAEREIYYRNRIRECEEKQMETSETLWDCVFELYPDVKNIVGNIGLNAANGIITGKTNEE